MIKENPLLRPEVIDFIKDNENKDLPHLILKGSPFKDIKIQSIAQQIKGRQVSKTKFPELYENEKIIYPPRINLEQASSETTAAYRAKFIKDNESILDLTGGMGIDCLAFSIKTKKVLYAEINEETFSYAKQIFSTLKKPIKAYNGNGLELLKNINEKLDWIYIDPARRDIQNKKVFRLEDCTPNILEHLDILKSKARKLLIKTSPLLDIDHCFSVLPNIKSIHIIAVKNEVKELLIEINFEQETKKPKVIAENLETSQQRFVAFADEKHCVQEYELPQKYLYEPNASLMKSGFFGKICQVYNVKALAEHSHLFTSKQIIDFPGRVFEIQEVTTPKKKLIKKHLRDNKANISTRNYPLKPEQIKKKYEIIDGGSKFVFFTNNYKNEKIVIICNKIN